MRFPANKQLILLLIGLAWAELALIPYVSIRGIKPDLVSLFLVFYAFRIDWKRIVVLAFIVGLTKDLITNSFFGLETASYVASSIALQFFAVRFDRDKRWIQLVSLFGFTWLSLFLFLLFGFLVQAPYHLFNEWMFVKTLLITSATTLAGWLLFPLLDRWLGSTLLKRQYELF